MATVDVPKQQRAAVRQGSGDDATAPVKQVDVTMPGKGKILVKINWTGLCASVSLIDKLELSSSSHLKELDVIQILTVA